MNFDNYKFGGVKVVMKSKKLISIILVLTVIIQLFGINIFSASAIEQNNIDKMVEIAKNEVGYFETTYSDGSFYSKYGDWYGYPNEPWCAMFVSWCANQAGISSNVIPKFSSCNKGREWFVNKCLWRTKDEYIPKSGDIVFLNNYTHVGIVEKYSNGTVFTIEGNSSDENGENFGVRQKMYSLESNKITGFGIPDLNILSAFNGVANKKSPAYMLPDNTSQTVWEVWQDDELEILCKDASYYLVMYPFLNTGKFVCAYVSEEAVTPSSNIPEAKDFYNIRSAVINSKADVYHNPSDSSLLSNSNVDKKIRATLSEGVNCKILFEKENYYFIKTNDGITGFINPKKVDFQENLSDILLGDVNGDNVINTDDCEVLEKYIVSESYNINIEVADVNFDKKVNMLDLYIIKKYIADNSSNKYIGKPVSQLYTILGDVNFDGNISILDVTLTQKHLSGLELFNATQITNADVDSNNKITIDDVTIIQKYIAGLISDFPAKVQETTIPTSNPYIEAQSVTIDNTNPNILNNGDTLKLNATVYPANTTDKSIIWSSSNPDVASVDSNGLVTAKTAGAVTITATCVNTSINATAKIRVNQITSYIGDGNYCFKLKDTNSYIDHQGGNSNGTNVHLWSGDGNSNPNQKIKLVRIDDNRYMLKSAVNNDLLLDVNRGNSYSDPITIGKNIDLWQNNDWQAQEWLFTKTYDGYYIIRLNMYQGGAIEASGKNNGDNIFFGTYNPDNDMQKWELINTSEYVEPETNGWVYNTQDIGNVNVRSGPGTNYPSIGGFSEGQQITIIGSLNGDWYKVRGANRHDGSIITGYCHKDYITTIKPVPVDPDNPAPNLYSNSYNKTVNPFAQSNLYGQCTWYAWGRANEVKGTKLPCRGDAKSWYSVAANNGYSVGSTPRKNSIAVWSNGTYGHVAYVEKVSGNNVTITESNWDRVTYDYQYSIEKGIYYYSGYKTLTVSQMNSRCGTLLGYIYL